MTKHALEIVEFQLNSGASDTQFLAAIEQTKPFISSLDGFMSRHTAKNHDGTWVDVVKWRDLAAAQSAAKQFETAEAVKPFVMMIEPSTIKMQHFEVEHEM